MGKLKELDIMARELAKHEVGFENILPNQQEQYITQLGYFLTYLAYNNILDINEDLSAAIIAGTRSGWYEPNSYAEHLLYVWAQGFWSGYAIDDSGVPGSAYSNQ